VKDQANTFTSAMSPAGRREWFAFGLWLRLLIAGVALLAAGVVLLLMGTAVSTLILAFVIGGGILALIAWRRIGAALAHVDQPEAKYPEPAAFDFLRAPYPLTGAGFKTAISLPEAALESFPR